MSRILGQFIVFTGMLCLLFIILLQFNQDPVPASVPAPTSGITAGAVFAWGFVIIILALGSGISGLLIYWLLTHIRRKEQLIEPDRGLFPIVTGRLDDGSRYVYDPNRAPAALTLFNAKKTSVTYLDGGPEASRIINLAQFTQALQAGTGKISAQQLAQSLQPQVDDLPPLQSLPNSVEVSHLDRLLDR